MKFNLQPGLVFKRLYRDRARQDQPRNEVTSHRLQKSDFSIRQPEKTGISIHGHRHRANGLAGIGAGELEDRFAGVAGILVSRSPGIVNSANHQQDAESDHHNQDTKAHLLPPT